MASSNDKKITPRNPDLPRKNRDKLVLWSTISFVLFSVIVFGIFRLTDGNTPFLLQVVYLGVALLMLTLHGLLTHGLRRLSVAVLIFTIIPLFAEWIGVKGGWLFGSYSYSHGMGPLFPFGVPAAIPLLWFVMGYCIQHFVEAVFSERRLFWKVLVSAWLLAVWDMAADPAAVSFGWWTWETGGAYFGIPIRNYFGWMSVGLISFSLLYSFGGRNAFSGPAGGNRILRAGPTLALFFIFTNNCTGALQRGETGVVLTSTLAMLPFLVMSLAGD